MIAYSFIIACRLYKAAATIIFKETHQGMESDFCWVRYMRQLLKTGNCGGRNLFHGLRLKRGCMCACMCVRACVRACDAPEFIHKLGALVSRRKSHASSDAVWQQMFCCCGPSIMHYILYCSKSVL